MPTFKYKAVSRDGAAVNGVVEAFDEFEAVAAIKESCPIVTSIKEVESREAGESLLTRDILPKKISLKALSLLCSQFAIILNAGLPVARAVALIQAQTGDKALRKLLGKVAEDVAGGHSLAQSFEHKGGKLLPPTFIETLRAGEDSGTLDAAFRKLATYYDKAAKVKAKVRSAMIYPIFLSVLAVVVVAFIMAVVMPKFVDFFDDLGAELPALTRGLMAFSDFCARFWWLIFMVIAALVIAFKVYANTEQGRLRFARLRLRMPLVGRVVRMTGASQLANTLSTLLTAGLPMVRAVASTARALDNYHLSQKLGSAVTGLESGRRLGDCLKECGCFPELLTEMAAVGEEAGSLEETLDTIGVYYDSEVELATNKALSMIQPAITIIMGIIIGVIVVALYLPMFSMYASM